MKTYKLDKKAPIATGFVVPDNFFEDFEATILTQLHLKPTKVVPLYKKTKTWFFAIAAVLVVTTSLVFITNFMNQQPDNEVLALENYINDHANISDHELVSLLEENDIQKISIDLGIDEKTIENELSTDANLEQYLIN